MQEQALCMLLAAGYCLNCLSLYNTSKQGEYEDVNRPLVTDGWQSSYNSHLATNMTNISQRSTKYNHTNTLQSTHSNMNHNTNISTNPFYTRTDGDANTNSSDHRTKFRAFVIAYHKKYGYLLLQSFKKKKGNHFQLPGGRIDKNELRNVSLAQASLIAAKRELFEETGLQIHANRLKPINLGLKNRLYYELLLTDADSLHLNPKTNADENHGEVEDPYYRPRHTNNTNHSRKHRRQMAAEEEWNASMVKSQRNFVIKLSAEHNGWQFEPDIYLAAEMCQQHSGGKNSMALKLYAQRAKHEKKRAKRLLRSQSHSNLKQHKKHKKSQKHKDHKHKHSKHKHKNKATKQKQKQSAFATEDGDTAEQSNHNSHGHGHGNHNNETSIFDTVAHDMDDNVSCSPSSHRSSCSYTRTVDSSSDEVYHEDHEDHEDGEEQQLMMHTKKVSLDTRSDSSYHNGHNGDHDEHRQHQHQHHQRPRGERRRHRRKIIEH